MSDFLIDHGGNRFGSTSSTLKAGQLTPRQKTAIGGQDRVQKVTVHLVMSILESWGSRGNSAIFRPNLVSNLDMENNSTQVTRDESVQTDLTDWLSLCIVDVPMDECICTAFRTTVLPYLRFPSVRASKHVNQFIVHLTLSLYHLSVSRTASICIISYCAHPSSASRLVCEI